MADFIARAWPDAPRDGTIIDASFRDGTTSKMRWSVDRTAWEVARSDGRWVLLQYERGACPLAWRLTTD